jgi:type IV secretion system protein VirB3
VESIERTSVFIALTRPQMFAGVTYSYFVANAVVATELFLIFRSGWIVAVALLIHLAGMLLCLREPRFFDLWLVRLGRCPRIRNHAIWQCNSYQP